MVVHLVTHSALSQTPFAVRQRVAKKDLTMSSEAIDILNIFWTAIAHLSSLRKKRFNTHGLASLRQKRNS